MTEDKMHILAAAFSAAQHVTIYGPDYKGSCGVPMRGGNRVRLDFSNREIVVTFGPNGRERRFSVDTFAEASVKIRGSDQGITFTRNSDGSYSKG